MRRVPNPVKLRHGRGKSPENSRRPDVVCLWRPFAGTGTHCSTADLRARPSSPPRSRSSSSGWTGPSSTHIIFSAYATLSMVRQNGSFRMRRPRFQRTVQNPLGMPRAAVIAATIAVALLANGTICTAVHAQQRDPVDQRRLEAPIGHRQPRPQDLPSRAPQDENNARDINRSFDVSPEINICRGC
jgi:hypothetical protein